MSFHDTVAANLPPVTKVMLTCFESNKRALAFYTRQGFQTDDISPVPRKLRGGKMFVPDYVIMSKPIASCVEKPLDESRAEAESVDLSASSTLASSATAIGTAKIE
jgi:hypothetical protein